VVKRPTGNLNRKLRKAVFATYGDICWLCGNEGADTIDHLEMITSGGDNSIQNLRPAHGRKTPYCNGNFSRKRGRVTNKPKHRRAVMDIQPAPVRNSDVIIEYGEGWIKKTIGQSSNTIYTGVTCLDQDQINDWVNSR
jgi:hypothetical protein